MIVSKNPFVAYFPLGPVVVRSLAGWLPGCHISVEISAQRPPKTSRKSNEPNVSNMRRGRAFARKALSSMKYMSINVVANIMRQNLGIDRRMAWTRHPCGFR